MLSDSFNLQIIGTYQAEFVKTAVADLPTECTLPNLAWNIPTLVIDDTVPLLIPHVDVQTPVVPHIHPCIPTLTSDVSITACSAKDNGTTISGDQLQIVADGDCGYKIKGNLEICTVVPPIPPIPCIPTFAGSASFSACDTEGNPITVGGSGLKVVADGDCGYKLKGDVQICAPCIPKLTSDISISSCDAVLLTVTGTQISITGDECHPHLTGSIVICPESCMCEVTGYLDVTGVIIPGNPPEPSGIQWIESQARSTTLVVRGKSNGVSASSSFGDACPGCIFNHHTGSVKLPCDPEGYEGKIVPATNWIEGSTTWVPVYNEGHAVDGHPNSYSPMTVHHGGGFWNSAPAGSAGSADSAGVYRTEFSGAFGITTIHNIWSVVVNGKLLKSYNADSPPYDDSTGVASHC